MREASASLALYSLSEELTVLLDTVEMTEENSPERQECQRAIQHYQAALPSKVDATAHYFAYLDDLEQFADREIKRLQARKAAIKRRREASGVLLHLRFGSIAGTEEGPAEVGG